MSVTNKNKVIVAPLNWGWGHVARCVPIIREIELMGLVPVLACDSDALLFLKKEFPTLETITLSSYDIKYARHFKLGMICNIPNIVLAILKEHKEINAYLKTNKGKVLGLISDNRLGVHSKNIKSVYITHQLNIKAGILSPLINFIHHYYVKKHDVCWVPDELNSKFTGELSLNSKIKTRYIGLLSRFKKQELSIKYDLLVVLSGVEGQRVVLERVLAKELKTYKGKALVVRGSFNKTLNNFPDHVEVVDYMLSNELEEVMNSSKLVLCRSGYSTVMDLITLGKSAFFIPTPGQTEQEYLACFLSKKKQFTSCAQKDFKMEMIDHKKDVDGFVFKTHQHLLKNELIKLFMPFQA